MIQLEQVSCCCWVCPCKQGFRKVTLSLLNCVNCVAFLKNYKKKRERIKVQDVWLHIFKFCVPELFWVFSFQSVKTNWFMPLEFLSHKLLEQQSDICFQVRQRLSSYAYSYTIYLPGLEKRNQHKSKQQLQKKKYDVLFQSMCWSPFVSANKRRWLIIWEELIITTSMCLL